MEIKCLLPKFDAHLYPACFMHLTSAQFGYYNAFPVAPQVPSDGQPTHLEYQRVHPQHGYYNLIPSTSPVPEHGFINPVPPDSRYFHPYDCQNVGSLDASLLAVGTQMVHLEFQDTAPIDWDIYPLLLNLTLADADVSSLTFAHLTNPRHYPTIPSQEAQNLHSAPDPPLSSTLPTRVGEPEEAKAQVNTISQTELWPYLDVHDDGVCVCLWEKTSGDVCGFRSSTDLVKRHLRQKHFKSKRFACPVCNHMFFSSDKCALHINVHTGSKPYQCYHCELRFASPSARCYHAKSFHSRTTLRPY